MEVNADKTMTKDSIIHNKVFYLVLFFLLILIAVSVGLSVQNHSLKVKLADQEALNDGLVSENQELNEKTEDYYAVKDAVAEKDKELNLVKADNSKLEADLSNANKELTTALAENELLKEQNDTSALEEELANVRGQLETSTAKAEKFSDIYEKLLNFMETDYLGTNEYHSDQYIVLTDGQEKVITITAQSTKRYTTTVKGDNYNALTEWISPFENYQAQLKIIPKNEGITKFHFTNSFNSDSFDVIVVYLKKE